MKGSFLSHKGGLMKNELKGTKHQDLIKDGWVATKKVIDDRMVKWKLENPKYGYTDFTYAYNKRYSLLHELLYNLNCKIELHIIKLPYKIPHKSSFVEEGKPLVNAG